MVDDMQYDIQQPIFMIQCNYADRDLSFALANGKPTANLTDLRYLSAHSLRFFGPFCK